MLLLGVGVGVDRMRTYSRTNLALSLRLLSRGLELVLSPVPPAAAADGCVPVTPAQRHTAHQTHQHTRVVSTGVKLCWVLHGSGAAHKLLHGQPAAEPTQRKLHPPLTSSSSPLPVPLSWDHTGSGGEAGLLRSREPAAPLLPLRGSPMPAAPAADRPPAGVPALLLVCESLRPQREPGSGLGFELVAGLGPFSESRVAHTSSISSEGSVEMCSCLLLLLRPKVAEPDRWL